MTNPQQPEIRRSDESPTTKQRTEDADPTTPPHGSHDRAEDRPVPEGQVSPYGPAGNTAADNS
ncbi:hypothetical protein [Actinoplanes sp. RD1]|uniref:hypothetical protein n=1 Tax=Actinoplanes sp. RD1 TaxID=3064538 RepID=UPI002740AA8E|nr:hypothetical protein [Actinoplanes sp. RD1]